MEEYNQQNRENQAGKTQNPTLFHQKKDKINVAKKADARVACR